MTVYGNFNRLCSNLRVDNADGISSRYKQITKRLNIHFYGSGSETAHSAYVGSYGRGTAIKHFHDLDVLFKLPSDRLTRYTRHTSNGQSALLQEVRSALLTTYPNTNIGADGQVVVVNFSDQMRFEILPAFSETGITAWKHPDSNNGGTWRLTDPFPEIRAMNDLNKQFDGNLKHLCRMAQAWRRKWDVAMSGWLIDTLACAFLKSWRHRSGTFAQYDIMTRDFLLFMAEQNASQTYWLAPGSGSRVHKKGSFRRKAQECHDLAVAAIGHEANARPTAARNKWREIYGTFYT